MKEVDQITSTAIDLGMRFGPRLVVAVLILLAGVFIGRWAARATTGMLERFRLEPPVRALLERVVKLLVVAIFAVMALQNVGVELLPLIAGLSIAGAGVALAMQGVLGNVVAGLTIIFTKPFRVGDYISIVGEEGEVLEIQLFSTTLGHADLSRVVIPNRRVVGEILHNYGRQRQLALEVGIAYDADVGQAVSAIEGVLRANPRVLQDPAPVIAVARLADSSLTIAVKPWTSTGDFVPAAGEINRRIVETFRELRIAIPLPQREIRMLT